MGVVGGVDGVCVVLPVLGRLPLLLLRVQFAVMMTFSDGISKVVVALDWFSNTTDPLFTVQPLKRYPLRLPASIVTVAAASYWPEPVRLAWLPIAR